MITCTGKMLIQPVFIGDRRSVKTYKICLHGLEESSHEHDIPVGVKVIWYRLP